jgi:hypothetical protein
VNLVTPAMTVRRDGQRIPANFSDPCFSIGCGSDRAPSAEYAGLALRALASE